MLRGFSCNLSPCRFIVAVERNAIPPLSPATSNRSRFTPHGMTKPRIPMKEVETTLGEVWDLVIVHPELGVSAVVWYSWQTL